MEGFSEDVDEILFKNYSRLPKNIYMQEVTLRGKKGYCLRNPNKAIKFDHLFAYQIESWVLIYTMSSLYNKSTNGTGWKEQTKKKMLKCRSYILPCIHACATQI